MTRQTGNQQNSPFNQPVNCFLKPTPRFLSVAPLPPRPLWPSLYSRRSISIGNHRRRRRKIGDLILNEKLILLKVTYWNTSERGIWRCARKHSTRICLGATIFYIVWSFALDLVVLTNYNLAFSNLYRGPVGQEDTWTSKESVSSIWGVGWICVKMVLSDTYVHGS